MDTAAVEFEGFLSRSVSQLVTSVGRPPRPTPGLTQRPGKRQSAPVPHHKPCGSPAGTGHNLTKRGCVFPPPHRRLASDGATVADLPEVIGLLHRTDWTRLSLSAEVRFESGRAALLIAPGGHYRMEHQDEDGAVQGNDGQRGWTWWPSGRSEPSAAETGLKDGRPVAVLFCPQDLLDGYVLEILGPVTACGRDAIAIAATPRAGDRLRERVEAAVDAELGILLRREDRFRGQLLAVTELTDVAVNPPAAPDPAGFTAPQGSRFCEAPGDPLSVPDGSKAKNVVIDLALGGLGAVVKHAPHFPGRDADSGQAEAAMPSPDPDVLAAEDGSPPDDLLYLLYRTGEPRDLSATVREWHDLAVTTARMAQDVRAAGLGGVGSLIDALPGASGKTVTRTDARLRSSGPDRYRVDYLRRGDRSGLQVNACDGERYWRVFPDRTLTGPAAPLGTNVAHLIYPGWLLRCRLSGARDITYRGRRARQLRVNRGPGTGAVAGPLIYFPADAIVDAETGCLLRLIACIGDAPSAWWELDDLSTEPVDPDDFRVHVPPGTRVV
jgi:outer membrane lipoprotein-sorting protein